MEPALREGDRVVVESAAPSDLRRGDVVLFESPVAGLVVHRLVWKVPAFGEPRALFTKGDASEFCDRPVAAGGILGRVVAVAEGSRRRRLTRPAGYARWAAAVLSWGVRLGLRRIGRGASAAGATR